MSRRCLASSAASRAVARRRSSLRRSASSRRRSASLRARSAALPLAAPRACGAPRRARASAGALRAPPAFVPTLDAGVDAGATNAPDRPSAARSTAPRRAGPAVERLAHVVVARDRAQQRAQAVGEVAREVAQPARLAEQRLDGGAVGRGGLAQRVAAAPAELGLAHRLARREQVPGAPRGRAGWPPRRPGWASGAWPPPPPPPSRRPCAAPSRSRSRSATKSSSGSAVEPVRRLLEGVSRHRRPCGRARRRPASRGSCRARRSGR